jgi:DNA adenine methylase
MIFRYPGGKSRPHIQSQILRLLPPDMKEYREPLVGGGGVFWGVAPSVRRWINDIDPHLVSAYQALLHRPAEYIATCRTILPYSAADPHISLNGRRVNQRLWETLKHYYNNPTTDPAVRYLLTNRLNWLGKVVFGFPSRLRLAHPSGWDVIWSPVMEEAAKVLAGTRVTNGDFAPLLREAGDGVVALCDPPYVRKRPLSIDKRLYAYEFSMEDHARLAEEASRSPHRVLITYNDCPQVREWYKGWEMLSLSVPYVGRAGKRKERGAELIIANYEITQGFETTQGYYGRLGGLKTSPAKAEAARQNGQKGGRPPGTPQSPEARAKISAARRRTS